MRTLLPALTNWEYDALKGSIRRWGVILPVVKDENGQIIDGHQRVRACEELGINDYPVMTLAGLSDDEKRDHTYILNLVRRRLNQQQMRDLIAAELRRTPDLSDNWLAQTLGTTDKTVAAVRERLIATSEIPKLGALRGKDGKYRRVIRVTADTAKEAERARSALKELVEAARQHPERFGRLVERITRKGRVAGAYREYRIAQESDKIAGEPQPLPSGPFRVGVVDPPWAYQEGRYALSRGGVTPYPVMSIEDIKAIPVPDIMHRDSVLWLWVTNRHLIGGEALEILKHWGYRPVSLMTWAKNRPGTGVWLVGQTEHAILAVRGTPVQPLKAEGSLLNAPRPPGHSVKPDAFYERVERLCPGSKVEVFARRPRPGWTTWGSELWERSGKSARKPDPRPREPSTTIRCQ